MGLLGKLFGWREGSDDDGENSSARKFICECCGSVVDEEEVEFGECAECQELDSNGTRYCCGMIYEEGEDICASCGEWL